MPERAPGQLGQHAGVAGLVVLGLAVALAARQLDVEHVDLVEARLDVAVAARTGSERLAILPLPSSTAIEPMCSQMPSSRASAREVGDRRIALLGADGGEQALALHLHQRGDLGRLHVLRALPGRLANERAGVAQILLHVAARAHLHEADAEGAALHPAAIDVAKLRHCRAATM